MILLFTILLTITTVWFLAEPHFASRDAALQSNNGPDASRQNLEEQQVRCVQLLKDLELDFELRKISKEDYEQMRSALTLELAKLLERLDQAK